MSFLKITDPAKRDFMFQQYLKTKKNIQQDFLADRLGDISKQIEFTKIFKPITDVQTATQKALEENLWAIKALTELLATSISLSIKAIQYPAIDVYEDAPEPAMMYQGELASKYLKDYASKKNIVYKTFGIQFDNGKFYIGTKEIGINGDDVIVDGFTYKGTQDYGIC